MPTFTVAVEWLAGDGGFRHIDTRGPRDCSVVEVLADTETEAHLIACQMVACRPGISPTRSRRAAT